MFNKTNKQVIKFKAIDQNVFNVFEPPVPAKKMIPEWYKRQDKLTTPGRFSIGENGNPNHTIKACMPIFDVITAGYIFKLSADIHFINDHNGSITSQWSTNNLRPIESHPTTQYQEYKVPDGYHHTAFKFIQPWVVETPPGYSCLFMQPALRDDLPFQIIPAIVDTDKHPIKVNFPFFIKEHFEGTLEMGTPIMQIIPFKREEWSHEVLEDLTQVNNKKWLSAEGKIGNRYKSFFRTIKKWD
jgi:hypothetical protein